MNYMGSKSRLAKDLKPIIESAIDENTVAYIEPFVGGANMIDKIAFHNKIGLDVNPYLIALLQHAQITTDDFPDFISREEYNLVRESYNNRDGKYPEWYYGFVGFMGSYSGRFYDGGYAGIVGKRNYPKEKINNLIKQVPSLKDIKFGYKDFRNINVNKIHDCVIYCDPPYVGTTEYKTDKFDYEAYYDFVRKLSKNNKLFCSERYMPDDFEVVYEKSIHNSIKGESDFKTEKLFVYKG